MGILTKIFNSIEEVNKFSCEHPLATGIIILLLFSNYIGNRDFKDYKNGLDTYLPKGCKELKQNYDSEFSSRNENEDETKDYIWE